MARGGQVIGAPPEALALSPHFFARLAAVVETDCVLATNTSSLSVTALAAGLPRPGCMVGMHFFNPPAKMRLVEVVAGEESSAHALRSEEHTSELQSRQYLVCRL